MSNTYLLSGGLIREFRFPSSGSFKAYLLALEARKQSYHVLQSFFYYDDSVYARIITGYNGSPLTERGIVQDSLEVLLP